MRRIALIAALVAGLAGCSSGGPPRFARSDTEPLIVLANRIAREAPCAQARDVRVLRAGVTRLANTGRVSTDLLEPLSSAVNELALEARCD